MNMAYCKHCHTELEPQKEVKLLGQAEGPFACRMQGTENLSLIRSCPGWKSGWHT